jgi:hypothetical protein
MAPHTFATKFALKRSQSARRRYPVKAHYVVMDHSNIHSDAHATISHEQNFCAFPVGASMVDSDTKAATKNMSGHVIGTKDGVLSENVPPGAVDDDEFTRVSIYALEVAGEILRLALKKARRLGSQ